MTRKTMIAFLAILMLLAGPFHGGTTFGPPGAVAGQKGKIALGVLAFAGRGCARSGACVAFGERTAARAGMAILDRCLANPACVAKAETLVKAGRFASFAEAVSNLLSEGKAPRKPKSEWQNAPAPEEIEGKSVAEIDEMLTDRGWTKLPARKNDGITYQNPDRQNEKVRVMPNGTPNTTTPELHDDPYAIISSSKGKPSRVKVGKAGP